MSAAGLLYLTAWAACLFRAHSAEVRGQTSIKLQFIPPSPALIATAARNRIAMDGMSNWSGTNELQPGDSATVLITFVRKKEQTQWLLNLEAATPDLGKANKLSTFLVTSAFGPMKFKSRPYPVNLRMFGPFPAAGAAKQPKPEEKWAHVFLNEDFLSLGLDQPAALLYRWSRQTNFGGRVTSKALLAMKPSPEEQRALSGTFPALISYFNIVEHTEGLEDLLRKLIDPPSLWSILKHRGVRMTLTFGDGALPSPAIASEWNLKPSTPVYYFPWMLRLNDEPALKITLVTASSRPPLLICGGVVGVLAEKIGNQETYMTLRLVSARCAITEKN